MLEEAMAAHTDDEVLQESGVQLLEALRDWQKDNEEEEDEEDEENNEEDEAMDGGE
jgi:hypothetical protein